MLAPRTPSPPITVEDFFAFIDARPGERWELIGGRPVAMAGGTLRHALISANIAEALGPAARNRGCRALRDMYFRVAANDEQLFDPDVMIRCGAGELQARAIDDAIVVFEVLSPSTMHRDRGEKLTAYLQAPSLRQIVLVYPGETRLENWTREAGGGWQEEPQVLSALEDVLAIPELAAELPLALIYDGAR